MCVCCCLGWLLFVVVAQGTGISPQQETRHVSDVHRFFYIAGLVGGFCVSFLLRRNTSICRS